MSNTLVDCRNIGSKKPEEKHFALFWERLANSGVILVTATSKEEAIKRGWSLKVVKVTVVEMVGEPLIDGVET